MVKRSQEKYEKLVMRVALNGWKHYHKGENDRKVMMDYIRNRLEEKRRQGSMNGM